MHTVDGLHGSSIAIYHTVCNISSYTEHQYAGTVSTAHTHTHAHVCIAFMFFVATGTELA